jgi:selenocysteine lyase/cysteine desulfurase
MDKRKFLKSSLLFGLGASPFFKSLAQNLKEIKHLSPIEAAENEDFWTSIRNGYRLNPDYIYLEGGYYSIMPQESFDAYIEHVKEINYYGSYYMRTKLEAAKKEITTKLAAFAQCNADEIVITRNATESLDLIIGGIRWKTGDEAIMAEQDYGSMTDMFDLQSQRFGIVSKRISIPNNPGSDEEIVKLYADAITDKTRLIMVSHMINITGHILPVKKICDMAHSKGVEVMVDGAHSFAHVNIPIKDLGCDYYGASLHKWLGAPLGTGLLYIKKEKIAKLWPLFAEKFTDENNIARLNHTGTTPVHAILGISNAIDIHNKIGSERKEARLRYLQNYWTNQVRNLPHIIMNTPNEPSRSCAIANVGVKGLTPNELAKTLLDKYKIWTVAIDRAPNVFGCRITPNVFNTTKELDVFVNALKELG